MGSDGRQLKRSRCRREAFTLTEILLVVSLISIISLALYKSLSNGIRVWERNLQYKQDEDLYIALDKFSYDLRNTAVYTAIPFDGDQDKLAFASVVQVPAGSLNPDGSMGNVEQIGMIEYAYDRVHNALVRRQAGYGQAVQKRLGNKRVLVGSIVGMKFSYYYLSGNSVSIKAKSDDDEIPYAVEIEIKLREVQGGTRTVTRLVHVPVGLEYEGTFKL